MRLHGYLTQSVDEIVLDQQQSAPLNCSNARKQCNDDIVSKEDGGPCANIDVSVFCGTKHADLGLFLK